MLEVIKATNADNRLMITTKEALDAFLKAWEIHAMKIKQAGCLILCGNRLICNPLSINRTMFSGNLSYVMITKRGVEKKLNREQFLDALDGFLPEINRLIVVHTCKDVRRYDDLFRKILEYLPRKNLQEQVKAMLPQPVIPEPLC